MAYVHGSSSGNCDIAGAAAAVGIACYKCPSYGCHIAHAYRVHVRVCVLCCATDYNPDAKYGRVDTSAVISYTGQLFSSLS
eukprot:4774-Heterococcus_DN1.PRE.1